MTNSFYLKDIIQGFDSLSSKEHEVIYSFTLLWTVFEAQVLDNDASVKKISEKVLNTSRDSLVGDWFSEHLKYFSDRYIKDGCPNELFKSLNLRKRDEPELVRSVLTGEIEDNASQLIVCLIIVYRFRNNFFHGLKWAYGLNDQYDNFYHSVYLLKKTLEKFNR